jgi:AraC-like DNA-binding protein
MPSLRQRRPPKRDDPDATVSVRTAPIRFPGGYAFAKHAHAWDQLSFAVSGAMTVSTASGSWLVPPDRAVWVPASVEHSEHLHGDVAVRHLYIAPRLARIGLQCCTLNVSPLLREIIIQACRYGALDRRVTEQRHLSAVLLDLLAAAPVEPFQLPMPRDARALRAAERMLETPSEQQSRRYAAAVRVGERPNDCSCPRRDCHSARGDAACRSFSLRLLAAGESVTQAALQAGYSSTSAFIAVFRRELGTTPNGFREARTR